MIRQRIFDEIQQSIRNNINDRLPSADTKPGTWVNDVIVSPLADELAANYATMKIMEINQSILTASGDDLDRLSGNYFTVRRAATKATGRVRFYITGSNRVNASDDVLPDSVYIPEKFVIATLETSAVPYREFQTTESVFLSKRNINSLQTDYLNNYKYIEVDIEATSPGESYNVSAGTITVMTSPIEGIDGVANLIATTGGEDKENDISLRFRTMLAILGASICTKNGYLKFIIQQDYVDDALVIGGGDSIMFRDGGYLNAAKEYIYGRGGMVDIWVRGKQNFESTYTINLTTSYLSKENKDILLPSQPVSNIVSISSVASGYVYDNAADYEVEYGVSDNVEHETYYKDIPWDFTITDNFPDSSMYALDIEDPTEIEILKKKIDEELHEAINYLYNINYSINWALTEKEDVSSRTPEPMFQKVFYNGIPYKIIAVDKRLNGRTFVKKGNKIYLRYYNEPDYILVKDTYLGQRYESQVNEDLGNSIYATDKIHWIKEGILQDGDKLVIKYNSNKLIYNLQQMMNNKRILTADILLREAYEVPIQILMKAYCDENSNSTVLRNTIITKISTFIASLRKMGDSIEESTLVAIARDTYGITQVDLDSVSLSKKNQLAVDKIQLEKNEYFVLDNIDIDIVSEGSVIN